MIAFSPLKIPIKKTKKKAITASREYETNTEFGLLFSIQSPELLATLTKQPPKPTMK
jgi:hypothetical protein